MRFIRWYINFDNMFVPSRAPQARIKRARFRYPAEEHSNQSFSLGFFNVITSSRELLT